MGRADINVQKLMRVAPHALDLDIERQAFRIRSFKEQLEHFLTGDSEDYDALLVAPVSERLGIPEADGSPLVITGNVLRKIERKHGLDLATIDDLPQMIRDTPLALQSGEQPESLLVFLDREGTSGNPYLAVIKWHGEFKRQEVGVVVTVFDKRLESIGWLLDNAARDGREIYVNARTEGWIKRMRPVLPDAAKSVVKRKLAAITPAPIAGNGDQLPKDFTTPLHPTSMAGGEKAPAREKGSMMATEPTMSQTEELIRQHEEELALESRMLEGFNLSFQDGYDLIYEQIIEVGNIPYHIEFHLPGPLASASDPDITTDLIIKNMINGEKIVDRSQSGRDIPWALSCMKAAIKTATTTFPEKYSVVSTLSDAPHAGENYRPSLGIDADPVRQVAIEVATDALEEAFRTWPTGSKELEAALDKIAASYSEREGDRIYTDAWDRVYGEEYAKAHLHPYPEGLDGQMPVHIASQPDPQAMSAAEIEKGSTDMAEQTETKWVRMSMNGKLIKEVKPEDGPIFYSAYVPSGTKIGGGHVDIGNSNFTVPQNLVHASKFSAHDVVVAFPEDWDVKLTRSVLNEGTGEYTREPVATVKPQALKEALEAERQHWREARAEARSQAQEQAQAKTTVNTAEKVAKASADAQAKNAPTAPAKKQSK